MTTMSRRAKRMERNHTRNKQSALNLVSLMDIFTILVFFLLVSSSNVQQLPNSKDISLPTSVAEKAPKETLVIAITQDSIIVQGTKVTKIVDVLSSKEILIPTLQQELNFQASNSFTSLNTGKGRSVTIMGDENISYELLRKILATCRQTNYTKIAFAAVQKAKGKV
ncbi:MAG: biopolymer transporter ExbD [Gammaproteobacteria bacterium]|nr:biopolymer transporter ExbD [Gammaproteobacteria bacterium]MCW8988253.1 biopolymer transporter ExbD [Gammaproteobacteria bacterium]MCW9032211.1 biopolymer transporter ExbD [Gammaproteobacteria bacterium]